MRLSRDGVTVTMPMEQLVSDPAENIYAWPGDVLTLVRLPQTFRCLAQPDRDIQVDFKAEKITLADALASAGGLQDQRADPAGVFLFRVEAGRRRRPRRRQAADRAHGSSPRLPFDFGDANSYFFADRFPVEDKDVIYVSNASLSELQKFFTLLNTVTARW